MVRLHSELVRAQWRYSTSDGRFTLRWAAVRGADTVVALPRLAYPRGFDVHAVERGWCAARP